MAQRDAVVVGEWLARLALLTDPRMSPDALEAKIGALAGQILTDFPVAVICDASFRIAARRMKFFPSYAELFEVLDEFWRENKPKATGDEEQDETAAIARNWQRHASGDWGKDHKPMANSLRRELDYYRSNKSEVFNRLIATDDRALAIARANGWAGSAQIVPLRAAATKAPQVVRRGPPMEEPP
jgi:hypothetical protein